MCSQRVKSGSLGAGKRPVGAYHSPCARFKSPDDGDDGAKPMGPRRRSSIHEHSTGRRFRGGAASIGFNFAEPGGPDGIVTPGPAASAQLSNPYGVASTATTESQPRAGLVISEKNDGTLEQMTKQQLVEAVSEKTGQGRAEVDAVVDSILGTITAALSSNERVDLRGFGSFLVKEKKERQGRNPRTGETITIPAKRDVGFRAGKDLSEKLTQSKPEPTPA